MRKFIASAALAALALPLVALPAQSAQANEIKTRESILASESEAIEATGLLELDEPWQAQILPYAKFQDSPAQTAFVRLDNQKVALMVKDENGVAQPFVSQAGETGFWDLRGCGSVYLQRHDKRFACPENIASPFYVDGTERAGRQKAFQIMNEEYGFNTVQVTVNWAEWDHTTDAQSPTFDYALMDEIVADAAAANLKVLWVLFFHVQTNMPNYNDRGVYNLADGDGVSYGVQWNGRYRHVSNFPKDANSATPELYPEYWHPTIHRQIGLALGDLARHYKDSRHVIGYQVGNEEGPVGPYNDRIDTNPYYAATRYMWNERNGLDTGGEWNTDDNKRIFHRHIGLAVWQAMVEAMRTEDPYKFITTNFQSSDVDKDPEGKTAGWQNLDFYRDAGMDLIAPMYYGGTENIRHNIDRYYGSSDSGPSVVAQELPALFPSEIGIGWDRGHPTTSDVMDTWARGGLGYGLYSVGEMINNSRQMKQTVKALLAMGETYSDELWSGQPVSAASTRNIHMQVEGSRLTLSTLEANDPGTALGVLWKDYGRPAGGATERAVTISFKQAGTYEISAQVNAQDMESETITVGAGESHTYRGVVMDESGAAFIKVKRL